MEKKKKKTIHQLMRSLHRDIGYIMFGLVILFAISGVALVFRDTNFLKVDQQRTMKIQPNLPIEELGMSLRMRDFKATSVEGGIVYYEGGYYNSETGEAIVTVKDLVFPINKFTQLHKIISSDAKHWFIVLYGILMLFMAVSSIWMFKKGTKQFKRGMIFAVGGVILTIILLMI